MIFRKNTEWMGNGFQIYAIRPFWLIKAAEWLGYSYVGPMISFPIERVKDEVDAEIKDFITESIAYAKELNLKNFRKSGKPINHYKKR